MPNFYGNAAQGGGVTGGGSFYSPSNDFHSRNASTTPTDTGASGQATGTRPYADVGKFSLNLFGPSPTPPTPAALQVQAASPHPLDSIGIGHIPIIGDLLKGATNLIASAPDITPWNLAARGLSEAAWALRPENDPEKLALEQQIRTGWLDAGQAHAQAWRHWFKDNTPLAALQDYVVPDDNMGEGLLKTVGILGLPMNLLQRGIVGGTFGRQRLESLLVATDAELENNPQLLKTRDDLAAGKITDNDAYDQLKTAGFLLSNPRGAAHGPILGTIESAIQQLGTDPLVIGSFGVAGVEAGVARAGATLARDLTGRLGATAVEDLSTSYLARTGVRITQNMGTELLDEALINPATSAGAQEVVNGLGRTTKFFTGAGGKVADASATALKIANLGYPDQIIWHHLAAPLIVRFGRAAGKVLDKMTLFGRDDAAKGVDELIGKVTSEGAMRQYGLGTVLALRGVAEKHVGKDAVARLDEYIQRGIMQTTALVGTEAYTRRALSSQMFDFADHPVDLAMQAARLHGSDLGAQVRDKLESVAYRVIPTEGETMEQALVGARVRAAQQIRQMLGVTSEQANAMVEGQGEKFISLVDYAHFGYATKSFIGAVKAATKKAGSAVADNLSFMGPRQLSRAGLKDFRAAIKAGNADAVRSIARQYDQLYFNLATDLPDEDLLHWAKQLADGLAPKLPTEITNLSKVPKEVADWAKAHPGYRLMQKPEDQWGAIISKEGQVVGLNPYLDWMDEFSAPLHINAFKAKVSAALSPIASSTIQRAAMHRFSQRMGTEIGMPEAISQRVFWAIAKRAELAHVTPRGLERGDFYKAASEVRMPKTMRNKMTEAQVAEAAIWAHEGNLGQVGITQKLTGKVKTGFAGAGNTVGYLTENIYPKVRFKWNPWFQTQELIETPILLGGRGVWPGTGGGTRLLNARTEYVRGKLAQMSGFYKGDQLEYSNLQLAGARAGENIYGAKTRMGRMLQTWTPGQVKRAGESAMLRHELGAQIANDLKREAPTQFAAVAQWNATRALYHTIDDGETAVHMLYDMFSRTDPEGALRALDPAGVRGVGEVFNELGPAAFRASHIGMREPVGTPLLRYLGIGKGWQDTSWSQYRNLLRDPNVPEHTVAGLAEKMRSAGASEDYIDRATAMVTFPKPGEYYKAMLETSGKTKAEVDLQRSWDEQTASDMGIPLHEYLSRQFADKPQTLDALGTNRGWSLFQRILQAHEARGFDVVGIDSPVLQHLRTKGSEYLPDFTYRTDVPVNQLTSLEKKARDWTQARAAREANPALGQPVKLLDTEGNEVQFIQGRHQSGIVAPHEWTDMLEGVMTQDQIREATDWYIDMRRGFLAQYDNDVDAATRGILGFALTQKNTSPANGMAHLYAALEKVRRGERLPIDQKFDGLATEELKRLLEEGTITDAGIAQKLTDFIDSLLGNERRTAGVHGPDGNWQPSAIDIWAKRDIGHLDSGIKPQYWKRITGASSVRKVSRGMLKADGTPLLVTSGVRKGEQRLTTDVELTFADGRVQTIPGESLGAEQPNHLQYDHGVEFYNGIKDHLNREHYLNKEDWTAADVQALGWFRAKMAFGDDTGSPLDAFFRNHYNVNFEVMPAEGTRFADLYPGLANDGRVPITHAQAAAITSDVMDTSVHEAARVSGVQIIGKHGSTGTWTDAAGVANITPNVTVEVLGTDDGVRRFMAAVGHLNQQSRVRATKTVVTKALPSESNGMRWAYDWPLPKGITKQEADEIHAELIAHDSYAAGGSSLITYADGSYAVRSIWEPEAGVPYWQQKEFAKAVPESERLSLMHSGPMYEYSDDGFRRGRYVDQAEMDELQGWGDRLKSQLDNALTDAVVPLDDAMINDIMSRVRETPWNGTTVNLRRGVAGYDAQAYMDELDALHEAVDVGTISPAEALGRQRALVEERGVTVGYRYAPWGATHGNSGAMTGEAAHIMGIDGYRRPEAMDPEFVQATEGYLRGIAESRGTDMPLFSGQRVDGRPLPTVGSTVDLPLVATTPSKSTAHGFSQSRDYRNKTPGYIVEFAPGTRATAHDDTEFLTAGRFHVDSIETIPSDTYYGRTGHPLAEPVQVVRVSQTEVFDPAAQAYQTVPRTAGIPGVGPLPKGKPGKGPFITGTGTTASLPFQNVTEARFRSELQRFVEENRAELAKRGRYLGVFRDEDAGRFDFDVALASWDEDEAEALQLALGREGGAYDTYSGNGVYKPVLRPDTVPVREPTLIQPVRQRVHYHSIEANHYAEEMAGAGRKGAEPGGTSADWVRGDSERRTREAVERAYRTHAGYETTAFRAERAAAGDTRYLSNADDLAAGGGGAPGDARLFQSTPRGKRALTRFDSAIPGIGRPGGRASFYFKPGASRADTLLHERAHAISNELDDSAKRLYLNDYKRRLGLKAPAVPKPGNGAKAVHRLNNWDENVHEAFANDLVEYFRTGEPVSAELKPLFDYYGKRIKSAKDRLPIDPQTKGLMQQLVGTRSYRGGYHFNPGEKALMDLSHANFRRSENVTNGLIYFKGERSWLERSINHQYLGLYPASYFWGKILPEMVEFLAFRPFGIKAPFVALEQANMVYQHVMTQQEYDPEFRKWMTDNEPYLRQIAAITPGLPWDFPVNSPLWIRRTVEGLSQFASDKAAGKITMDKKGHTKDEWDVLQQTIPKAIQDSVDYAIGPSTGSKNIAQFLQGTVGAASQLAGVGFNALPFVPKPAPEPGFGVDANAPSDQTGYVPPFTSQVPTTLEQAVQRGEATALQGTTVEEVQAELQDQLYSGGG
jgi:hypothetical protein